MPTILRCVTSRSASRPTSSSSRPTSTTAWWRPGYARPPERPPTFARSGPPARRAASRSGRALIQAFVWNMDGPAAVLAVHRVEIMAIEPAVRTGEADFRRPEDGLPEPEEQTHPHQHDGDGAQPPAGAGHGDVAATGGGPRRHRAGERPDAVPASRNASVGQ